jgi:hypothetical protein
MARTPERKSTITKALSMMSGVSPSYRSSLWFTFMAPDA